MKRILHKLFCFALFMCIASCVSTKKLYANQQLEITPYVPGAIDGTYVNQFDSSSYLSLWNILYCCHSWGKDTSHVKATDEIKLHYDGKKYLTVMALDSGRVLKQFRLKAQVKNNYLSVKKNVFVIPIPMLFYLHHEIKVLLATNKSSNLIVTNGRFSFAWIIMAAGVDGSGSFECKRIK